MRHYIAMFAKTGTGQWRAVFPDFPDCEAAGQSLDATTVNAFMALTQHAHSRGLPLPVPRSLAEVRRDTDWIAAHGIALEAAIVSLIPLNGFDNQDGTSP
jgi:predicted RNase H-like HicB family nuclease